MPFKVNELDLNLFEYNLDDLYTMKPLERPSDDVFHLMSQTFEEITSKLLDTISNNEIEQLPYSFNLNQSDLFYSPAKSVNELLEFLVNGHRSIIYENKLVIIKNPDDSLKLYKIR